MVTSTVVHGHPGTLGIHAVTVLRHLAAIVAIAAPMSFGFGPQPSGSAYNEAIAWFGWGLLVMTGATLFRPALNGGLRALLMALFVLALATVASISMHGLPPNIAIAIVATLTAAATVAWMYAGSITPFSEDSTASLMSPLCTGLLIAGALGTAIGAIQVFRPDLADGILIAQTQFPGRAVGNLRQPNHLATLLLWAALAAAWRFDSAARRRPLWAIFYISMLVGVSLSTSRTGAVESLLVCVWGLLDRRLATKTRVLLISAPVVTGLAWALLVVGLPAGGAVPVFDGAARLTAADVSSSRFGLWRNVLSLIHMYPWLGVGVGEFNHAWTLTEFDDARPSHYFTNAHNLPLQFLVELGLPCGALVVALLGYSLWKALAGPTAAQRFAAMMLMCVALHSLLEFPLWYANFLFPTAAMLGLCVARASGPVQRSSRKAPIAAGFALSLIGALAAWDYSHITPMFISGPANTLDLRIARAMRGMIYADYADYALIRTRPETPALQAFVRTTHRTLEPALMIDWAKSFAASGDLDRARWVAARLRDFTAADAGDFFAVCKTPDGASHFQCQAPSRHFTAEDF